MITVLGSTNLDQIGTVTRLPAPGETVAGGTFTMAAGGKGANQALAARRAGAEVRFVSAVGRDAFADLALAELRAGGVDLADLRAVDAPTGIAMILVDGSGENVIAVLPGANADVDQAAAERALSGLGPGDLLLLQQEIPQSTTRHALALARALGVTTLLNTAPYLADTAEVAALADIVVANETEFDLLAPAAFFGDLEPRMRTWAATHRQTLVVTLGGEGVRAATPDGFFSVPAPRITPVDTVGAGDTFCGYLAASLASGLALEPALRRAVVAGSLACLKPGAQPSIPQAAEVDAALSSGSI